MQLIITDAWVAKTRAVHLNGLELAITLILIYTISMAFALAVYHGLFSTVAGVGWSTMPSQAEMVSKDETLQKDRFLRENLNVLARRLGEIQAKVIQLESLGERISGLAGITGPPPKKVFGKGGALVLGHPLSMLELESTLSSLERLTRERTDTLTVVESRLLDKKIRGLMVPTGAPVEDGVVGSSFGWRVDPINGQSALHTGLDFQAVQGTPILAAAGGVVVTQEYHPAYGNMVEIDHGNDLITRYAHAVKTMVKKGDLIKRGQLIAEVGTTGRSTGPHLHFEVLVNGIPQDPQRFLDAGKATEVVQAGRNPGTGNPDRNSADGARELR
jgi:murein DD-endopeptidase MepM/ murein hydrolase activator NlpD